jgi:hypothetical protein
MIEMPLILIGGCGSSGTTLLSHLLNAHPKIACGPELYLFCKKQLYTDPEFSIARLEELLTNGIATRGVLDTDRLASSTSQKEHYMRGFLRNYEAHSLSKEDLITIAGKSPYFKDFTEQIASLILERSNKCYWAEKTPTNCYCIPEILSLYPSAKYIQMVRDGRDVVLSLMKRESTPEQSVRRWIYDTALGLSHRTHDRYFELKYEDLVTNPHGVMKTIFEFLGIEADIEAILQEAQANPSREQIHSSWNQKPNSPISPKSVGLWKQEPLQKRDYLQQLFYYTKLSDKVVDLLGLQGTYNGIRLLEEYNYDLTGWESAPRLSLTLLKHFVDEKRSEVKSKQKEYFRVLI